MGGIMQLYRYAFMNLDFPQRLAALRREKGMTQQALADAIGIHVSQLKRYEAGKSQPTLDVLRKLAIVLTVSADALLFDAEERQPEDAFRLHFEAIKRMPPEDRQVIASLINAYVKKQQIETRLQR